MPTFTELLGCTGGRRLEAEQGIMEIIHEGFLVKSPPEKKLQAKIVGIKIPEKLRPKWQRRYFILYKPSGSLPGHFALDYYKDKTRKKQYGSIDLEQCEQVIASLDSTEYCFLFSIKSVHRNKNRTYFLAAETEAEMNEWVNRLCCVCGLKEDDEEEIPGATDISMVHNQSPSLPPPTPPERNDSYGITSQNHRDHHSPQPHDISISPDTFREQAPYTSQQSLSDLSATSGVSVFRDESDEQTSPDNISEKSKEGYIHLDECYSGNKDKPDVTDLGRGGKFGKSKSQESIPESPPPPPPLTPKQSFRLEQPAGLVASSPSGGTMYQQNERELHIQPENTYKVPKKTAEENVFTYSTYNMPRTSHVAHNKPNRGTMDSIYDVPPTGSAQKHGSVYDLPPNHSTAARMTYDSPPGTKSVYKSTYDTPPRSTYDTPPRSTYDAEAPRSTYDMPPRSTYDTPPPPRNTPQRAMTQGSVYDTPPSGHTQRNIGSFQPTSMYDILPPTDNNRKTRPVSDDDIYQAPPNNEPISDDVYMAPPSNQPLIGGSPYNRDSGSSTSSHNKPIDQGYATDDIYDPVPTHYSPKEIERSFRELEITRKRNSDRASEQDIYDIPPTSGHQFVDSPVPRPRNSKYGESSGPPSINRGTKPPSMSSVYSPSSESPSFYSVTPESPDFEGQGEFDEIYSIPKQLENKTESGQDINRNQLLLKTLPPPSPCQTVVHKYVNASSGVVPSPNPDLANSKGGFDDILNSTLPAPCPGGSVKHSYINAATGFVQSPGFIQSPSLAKNDDDMYLPMGTGNTLDQAVPVQSQGRELGLDYMTSDPDQVEYLNLSESVSGKDHTLTNHPQGSGWNSPTGAGTPPPRIDRNLKRKNPQNMSPSQRRQNVRSITEEVFSIKSRDTSKSFRKNKPSVPVPQIPPSNNRIVLPSKMHLTNDESSSESDDESSSVGSGRSSDPSSYDIGSRSSPLLPGSRTAPQGEVQYLDLDLCQEALDSHSPKLHTRSPPLVSPPEKVEYKEIDFVKTEGLKETMRTLQNERKSEG
ncbi:unnamed protein product [Owenia fusiformis]|uniref:PH domain-containing protein n=1 Tax=Owenia fusiformis TaxID=6347 RepID=A0A8S4N7N6_OWEFU|nr:unnamed protein product [Owenia fusiformis]